MPLKRLAGLTAAAVLGLILYWSLRLAWADYLSRHDAPELLRRATGLAPGNAGYRARLAEIDPAVNQSALREALRLNPRYSPGWIEMGLRAERDRDYQAAEAFLLEAARIDKTYDPRWTLANYYFRRQDWDKFWPWARRAIEMARQDPTPLFRLCWLAAEDPEAILSRAIPEEPPVMRAYLSFLTHTGRLEAARAVARRMSGRWNRESLPTLAAYWDRLVEAGHADEALSLWNGLIAQGLLPYETLAPARGLSLTNGEFAVFPRGWGFDWSFSRATDISIAHLQSPACLKIEFSGRQAEMSVILRQTLPLEPGRRYSLRYRYRTEGIAPGSGLKWSIGDAATRETWPASPTDLSSGDWAGEEMSFTVPAGKRLGRVFLVYERAYGTTRIEGSLYLQRVSLAMLD